MSQLNHNNNLNEEHIASKIPWSLLDIVPLFYFWMQKEPDDLSFTREKAS